MSPFDNVEKDLRGFGPWFFLSCWDIFHMKKISVLLCWFTTVVAILRTSFPKTDIVSGEEGAFLLRGETVSRESQGLLPFPPYMFDAYVFFPHEQRFLS
jgi:hypothetical protein